MQFGQTLASVMLRWRKAEVLTQLPDRVDRSIFVPLAPEQRRHNEESGDNVARIVTRWRTTGFLSDQDKLRMQLPYRTCACPATAPGCWTPKAITRRRWHRAPSWTP